TARMDGVSADQNMQVSSRISLGLERGLAVENYGIIGVNQHSVVKSASCPCRAAENMGRTAEPLLTRSTALSLYRVGAKGLQAAIWRPAFKGLCNFTQSVADKAGNQWRRG